MLITELGQEEARGDSLLVLCCSVRLRFRVPAAVETAVQLLLSTVSMTDVQSV